MSWTERPVDYDPFASPVKTLPVSKFTEIPVDYDPFATKKEEPSIEIPPPSATNQGRGIVDKLIDIVGAGGNAAMSESGMMTTADGDIAISPPKPKPLFQVSPRTISREKQLFEQGYDRGQVESIIGSNIRQEKLMSINEQEGQIKSVVDEMKTTSDPVKRLGLYSVVNRMVKDLKTNVSEYNSILSSLKGNKDQKLYESQYSDPWLDVVWKTLKTFPAKVATGAAGLAGAAEELLVNIPAEAQLMGDPSGTTWDRMREQGADSLAMKAAKTWGDVAREGSPVVVPGTQKAWFSSALDSVALNLPMALGGAVTGSITLPLVGMGLISGGQKYAELREQRPDIAIPLATAVAAGSGVMEGLTELIPLKTLLRTDLGFGKKLVNELFQEVPTEMANTIYGNLQDKMTTRPDMTWGDFIQDQIDTIGSTVIATPMMVGATHSAIKYLEKKQKQAIKATEKQVDQFLKDENVQELLKTPEGVERLKEKISKGGKPAGKRTESEKAPLPAMPPPSMGETPTDAALLFNRAGKPYKTEKSATEAMDKKGLGGTHEVVQVENGYALQKKTEKRPLVMPEPTAIAGLNDALASQAKPSPTETTTTTPQGPGAMQGESVSPVEGEKVFSTKPPIPLIEEILSNPEYYRKNKGVEATLSWMSPDEYLELQAKTKGIPLDQDLLIADKDLIAKYSDAMRKIASGEVEKQFPALWIEPANKNQEGRHRALAAKEAGVEKLPVYSINKIEEPAPTSQEAGTGTPEAPPEVPGGQSLPEEKVAAETKADVDPDATELKALIEVVQTSPREFDQSDPLTNMVSGEKYPRIFRDSIRDINFILDDRPDLKDVVPEELRKYVDENRAEKRWKELTPDVPPKPPEKKVFQKGDRVVVDGKHGSISKVDKLVMRPILGGGAESISYAYSVKFDSGRESAVIEGQIERETEKPTEPVTPDILVDLYGGGKEQYQDPESVVSAIQRAKQKARDLRAASFRARKHTSKNQHLKDAEDEDERAASLQTAFDAWAEKYPEAAEKYRPVKKPVMPPPAMPVGKAVTEEDADTKELKAAIAVAQTSPREFDNSTNIMINLLGEDKYPRKFRNAIRDINFILDDRPDLEHMVPNDLWEYLDEGMVKKRRPLAPSSGDITLELLEEAKKEARGDALTNINAAIADLKRGDVEGARLLASRAQAQTGTDLGLGDSIKRPTQTEKKPVMPMPAAKEKTETLIGKNSAGEDVYEDKNGVRYIYSGNIRHSEPVAMIPTRGGIVKSVDVANRDERYKTIEKAPVFGSGNKIFTEDKAAKAREILRKKLAGLNMGVPLDPEIIQAGIDLAGYYIEGGSRTFVDYSTKMITDLGDAVRPYLKSFYMAVRNYPGFDKTGMDNEAALDEIGENIVTLEDKKALMESLQKDDIVFYEKHREKGIFTGYFRSNNGGYITVVSGGGLSSYVYPADIIKAERDGKPIDIAEKGGTLESKGGEENERPRDGSTGPRPLEENRPGTLSGAGEGRRPGKGERSGGKADTRRDESLDVDQDTGAGSLAGEPAPIHLPDEGAVEGGLPGLPSGELEQQATPASRRREAAAVTETTAKEKEKPRSEYELDDLRAQAAQAWEDYRGNDEYPIWAAKSARAQAIMSQHGEGNLDTAQATLDEAKEAWETDNEGEAYPSEIIEAQKIIRNIRQGQGRLFEGDKNASLSLYSGLDPIAAMQALRDVAHDIKAALPRLEALGKSVYNSGITTAKEWYAAMHKHLGDLWFKFNWYLNGIWKNLQTMDRERKSLSEERGSFSWLKKAPKEKQEENPPGPEGETKESRQAIRAEEDAFAAGMEADFGDLVSYQTMNMNDLYDAAQGIVDADYASAKRMAMGDEKPPRGIHAAAMYEVVKLRAIREKDIDTLRLLATESIVPKMLSEMGQAIKAADSRIIADPVAAMSDVAKERAERIKRTTGEEYNEQAVNELRKKLEEAQKQLDKYIAENEERAAEEEIDRLIREKEKKTLKDLYGKRNKIVTRDEYNATLARIRERHSRLSMGIDPTELIDLAKIGIYHLEAGIRDFKLWSRQMTKDLGDWVKPHLPEIWDKAQEDLKQAAVKDVKQKVEREAKKTGGDLSELSNISMYAQKLAKEFIAQGTNDRNTLIDQVHDALKAEIDPEITRRETMDAISGYGQYKQLSKDEISVILRDLKGQMQQIAKIEDMVSGNAPLKTGVERRTPSDEERRLIKQVEEAKRKYGIQTTDKETQLRSALDAIKTRLRNQISDLEAQIKTGKKIVKGKSGVIYDAEANALVKRRDELKEAYTSIFGKPKMSDAQRLKMAIAAVQKSIAEYTKRINNNDVSPLVKPGKPISSPALDSLRSERERLRLEFKHLRDLANPRKTPEEIALQALKTRLKHEYEKMSKRLKDGDFTAREKREISLDDEGKRLKSERDKIRDVYNAAKEIGGTVSREEAGHILEMSSIVMEKKAAMDKGGNRLEYGAAVVAFERYIEDLKGENASIGEALGDRMREFRATFGRNKSKAFLDLAMDSIKKITDTSISLVASLDNSFLGRQGIKVLMTHPSAWWPAAQRSFSDIIVTIGGENAMDAMLADIYSRPNFVNGRYGTAKIISKTEEQYPTSLPEKMPVMGRFFKASQAAFRGSALRMRADLFDMLSQTAEDGGVKLDKQELIDIGKLINSLTARGQWGKRGEGAITRIILWAPKMLKANIDTLTAHRLDRDMESTFAKRQAAVNLVKIIAGCAVIMAIANALRPGSADTDPRSTDFGKIKIGDTRFDITGGMGSIITLAARIISQSSKSAATGIVTPLGSKFGQRSAFDVLSDFLVNKTSPPARVIVDWLRGKNWKGEKFSWSGSAYQAFTPIMLQNLIELKDKASADRVLGVLADALGISAQSFKASELKWDKDSSKEMNGFYRYAGDRRFTQANELYNRSVNRWFEKARNSENFKRLSDEEKLKIMRAAKREIKNQVFEHYGYK